MGRSDFQAFFCFLAQVKQVCERPVFIHLQPCNGLIILLFNCGRDSMLALLNGNRNNKTIVVEHQSVGVA